VGKIIRQINNDVSQNYDSNPSLAESRNTFINQNKINKNARNETPSARNPE
jgi:hypothetical protein